MNMSLSSGAGGGHCPSPKHEGGTGGIDTLLTIICPSVAMNIIISNILHFLVPRRPTALHIIKKVVILPLLEY